MTIRNGHGVDLPLADFQPLLRSQASLDFERVVRDLARVFPIPRRSQIDLRRFARFARWMAIGEIQNDAPAITLRLAGSGFTDIFGVDLTNIDYLQLVDPAIRDAAYESACMLVQQPCGLWQITPVATVDGKPLSLEYTVFPVLNDQTKNADVLVFARHNFDDELGYPRASQIGHATRWEWIDLGAGVPASPSTRAPCLETGDAQRPGRTILVVDDDALVRTVAAEYFMRHGFAVRQASNAAAALEVVSQANSAIDIVFSDVNMPEEMDGVRLCHLITKRWPHIPVLLASGNELPDGADLPATRFFLKPYRLAQVHRIVDSLLPSRQQWPT